MCCDGTFLTWAPVRPTDDLAGLESVGHPVHVSPERGAHFDLPCPALVDRTCSVYEHRPGICGSYRCALLQRFGRGEVARAEARDIVRSTLVVRDRVRAALVERLGRADSRSLFDSYRELQARHDAAPDPRRARSDDADLLIDIGMLGRLLSRYFDDGDPTTQEVRMSVKPA